MNGAVRKKLKLFYSHLKNKEMVKKKGQSNQSGQESRGKKGSASTSGDSKKRPASLNSEEQKEISGKRGKPSVESGNRIESNSSGIQLNKSSSEKENQGRSKGVGKRLGPQGKAGNR